jgi:hypothetical protein
MLALTKKSFSYLRLLAIITVGLSLILGACSPSTIAPTPTTEQICEEIAKNYYATHKYIGNDVFDCDNMACDIWDILIARGINARIVIGNVKQGVTSIDDISHAWVLAEASPGEWLAIECTGGYLVYYNDNNLYYYGIAFNNPKQLKDFYYLYDRYQRQLLRYQRAVEYYNSLVEQYNNSDNFTKLALIGSLNQASQQVEIEAQELQAITNQVEALFSQIKSGN